MEGPLESANQEIREAERHAVQLRIARQTEPQKLTDQLLNELEELNLEGVGTVPSRYEAMLADLRDQLGRQARVSNRLVERLHPGGRTAELIDTVFSIQEVIAPPTFPAGEYPFDDVM